MSGQKGSSAFIRTAIASGLLSREQLEASCQKLPDGFDDRDLARALVRDGLLTQYQAQCLLAGRSQGFFLGRYKLLEQIGSGGMAQVYKAVHLDDGRIVALKILPRSRSSNPEAVARFKREVRNNARLRHPNIVHAYELGHDGGVYFLVLEYVDGMDLRRRVMQQGPMGVGEAVHVVRQVCLALGHAARQGIVHRDIKPSNLLLTPEGLVKVLDMGLARRLGDDALDDSTITQEGTVVGSLDFMSPEQARNSRDVDVRSDIYSLGCTLYFLLTGQVPFPGGSATEKLLRHQDAEPVLIEQLRPEVGWQLALIVRKMMAKRPQDRFQTPDELGAALAQWASDTAGAPTRALTLPKPAGEPAGAAAGSTPLPPVGSWGSVMDLLGVRRRRLHLGRLIPFIGLAVVAFGAGVFLVVKHRPAPPPSPPPAPVVHAEPAPKPSEAVLPSQPPEPAPASKPAPVKEPPAVAHRTPVPAATQPRAPAPVRPAGPVAIVGQPDKSFATLAEAVQEAQAGDIIEIDTDRPLSGPTIRLHRKDLTIRSAKDRSAVLQAAPADRPIIEALDSDVTLQGLTFQAGPGAAPNPAMVCVSGGDLALSNCLVELPGPSAGPAVGLLIRGNRPARRLAAPRNPPQETRTTLLNTVVRGSGVALRLAEADTARIQVENCLLVSDVAVELAVDRKIESKPAIELKLERNTVRSQRCGLALRPWPADSPPVPLRLDARDNLFLGVRDAAESFIVLDGTTDLDLWRNAVSWRGEHNLLYGFKSLLVHGGVSQADDWRQWQRFWKRPDEVGHTRVDPKLPEAALAAGPSAVAIDAFRLPETSRACTLASNKGPLGADIDLVGPLRVRHGLASSTQPAKPSVAAETPKIGPAAEAAVHEVLILGQNRIFADLGQALEAAQSGDVIEIRGPGPYWPQKSPTPAAGRAAILSADNKVGLTIRAAQGVEPVIAYRNDVEPAPDHPRPLLASNTDLTLEGLHFQAYGLSPLATLKDHMALVVSSGKLTVRGCTFSSFGVFGDRAIGLVVRSSAEVTRSTLLGLRAGLMLEASSAAPSAVLTDCLLAGGPMGILVTVGRDDPPVRLVLRTSILADFGSYFFRVGPGPVQVEATGNIFYRNKLKPGQAMFYLAAPRRFDWREQQNLYHQVGSLAEGPDEMGQPRVLAETFKEVRLQWADGSRFNPLPEDPEFNRIRRKGPAPVQKGDYEFRPGGYAERRLRLGNRVGVRVEELPTPPADRLATFEAAPAAAVRAPAPP